MERIAERAGFGTALDTTPSLYRRSFPGV